MKTHKLQSTIDQFKNPPATQETPVQFLGWEDPLEEGMATHSSILAWRIPWTEEPGGLQSMVLQRVRHDWAAKNKQHREEPKCRKWAWLRWALIRWLIPMVPVIRWSHRIAEHFSTLRQSQRENNYVPDHWTFLKDVTVPGNFLIARELGNFQPNSEQNQVCLVFYINFTPQHCFSLYPFSLSFSSHLYLYLLRIVLFVRIHWHLFLIFFSNKEEDKDSMVRDFSLLYLLLNLQKVQPCLKQRRHSVNIC